MIARIALQILLLIGSAFFSGSETALFSLFRLDLQALRRSRHPKFETVQTLLEQPRRLIISILCGNELINVAATANMAGILISLYGETQAGVLNILIMVPLLLLFGEVTPKTIAVSNPVGISTAVVATPMSAWLKIVAPFRWAIRLIADQLTPRIVGPERAAEHLLQVDEFDRDRIMRVVRFADRTVNEAMIPIADMTMTGADTTTRQAITLSRRQGHFRLPVYRDKTTDIIGAVSFTLWDLMDPNLSEQPLSSLIRPVHYVAPNQRLDQLLPLLLQRNDHMAIVVDEFGSAIGMLTLEDVIEEVAGEVINVGYNFDVHVPRHKFEVESPQEGVYMMSARTPLAEAGEFIYVQGYRFIVEETDERSALQLKIVAPHQRGQI